MEVRELTSKEEMLMNYDILLEVYPSLTMEEYDRELDVMIPHNYTQIGVFEDEECIGLSGIWIGSKLWCGKYLEADNVVVKASHRSKGVGQVLFDYIIQKAKDEGCTMSALDSYTYNFKAHKFFYNSGYEPRGFHFINILDKSKIR